MASKGGTCSRSHSGLLFSVRAVESLGGLMSSGRFGGRTEKNLPRTFSDQTYGCDFAYSQRERNQVKMCGDPYTASKDSASKTQIESSSEIFKT